MKYLTLFAIGFGLLFGCTSNNQLNGTANNLAEETPILDLPVITLQEDFITLYEEFPAHIEGKVNVNIRSQVDGYIEKILVEEGSYVRAGQPLIKIDDRSYVEQVNNANANLNAALAALKTAKLEVEKYTLLNQNNVTSEFQLKTAQAQYETALATVAQQQAALETAKINLDFTLIKSPVSGFIGRIPKRIGNLASANDTQPLTTLSEISEVYAYFAMTETEFLRFNARYEGVNLSEKIAATDSVSLKLADNSEYSYLGKVEMINGEFDASTGTVSVRAVFENPHHLLRTGNTGRIVLPYTVKQVLLIPVLATLDIQDKIYVIRLDEANKAERVSITISHKQGDFYIVKSGLRPGDRIVSQDLESIEEGTIIRMK